MRNGFYESVEELNMALHEDMVDAIYELSPMEPKRKGVEAEGRPQVQAGDVADMLDHIQAEMKSKAGLNRAPHVDKVCPVCGADQTGKSWFSGPWLGCGEYQAVCEQCANSLNGILG